MSQSFVIAVLRGDGVGPEVMAEALRVLRATEARLDGVRFDLGERLDLYCGLRPIRLYNEWDTSLKGYAAGLVGGMGMAASADIGDEHAVFQPAHGTAPDIAGQGITNPVAMILSTAMMLDWLGHPQTRRGRQLLNTERKGGTAVNELQVRLSLGLVVDLLQSLTTLGLPRINLTHLLQHHPVALAQPAKELDRPIDLEPHLPQYRRIARQRRRIGALTGTSGC